MLLCNSAATPMETNTKLEVNLVEESVDGTVFKQIEGSLGYLCNTRTEVYEVSKEASPNSIQENIEICTGNT